jgi:hypothetical protein
VTTREDGVIADANWQPGDDLYDRQRHRNSLYLFNFRDDSESEDCRCMDSAGWPEPSQSRHRLPERDELGEFIREWHEWNRLMNREAAA